MRTVIVQAGLGAGGAEKIVSMLANHRHEQGDKVNVIAMNAQTVRSFFPYETGITLHALGEGTGPGTAGTLTKLRRLRSRLQFLEPHLVVSFLTKINVLVGIATIGLGVSTIISERNNFQTQHMHPVWRALARALRGRANTLVMQTERARAALPAGLRSRAEVIPNPIELTSSRHREPSLHPRFVAAGRLERVKGFDLLLRAFARATLRLPSASLTIFGDGPERASLQTLAEQLMISDRVELFGATKEPQGWLEPGSIFVLSSRSEGFPNVLVEALSTGMAAISFDCPWGPAEILGREDGYPLVPAEDVDALAEAMVEVAANPSLRQRLGQIGPRLAARYAADTVFTQWDKLIARTIPSEAVGTTIDAAHGLRLRRD